MTEKRTITGWLIGGSLFLLSSPASAQKLPFSELTALLHPIAVYGDHDHRLNEADFAASVGESKQTIHDRYAATGTLTCETYQGTAEIVLKNDTIVTAAHMFFFGTTCNVRGSAEKCVFSYTTFDGTSRTIKVKKMFDAGFKCRGIPKSDGADLPDPKSDWAVLKLESSVDEVTPYQAESEPVIPVAGDFLRAIKKATE
jgi:hypothetical protein